LLRIVFSDDQHHFLASLDLLVVLDHEGQKSPDPVAALIAW
jgi:hypothetical protein